MRLLFLSSFKNMGFLRIFKVFALMIMVFLAAPAEAAKGTLMVLGDSLVAGYGLPLDQAFPAQLEKKLKSEGHDVKVLNAGVSGDTSAGALARLEWSLQERPDWMILVIGGNDMLRAIDPALTRKNLKAMMDILKAKEVPVLIAGMRSFRNLGEIFGGQFQGLYEEIAEEYDAVFYPFFLEGVALDAKLNLPDGMHPNADGIALIVEEIYADVEDLLEKEKK